jgi:hypothetical protein
MCCHINVLEVERQVLLDALCDPVDDFAEVTAAPGVNRDGRDNRRHVIVKLWIAD